MANSVFTPFIRKGGAALAKRLLNGTIGYEPGVGFFWRKVIDFAKNPGAIGAVALDADTSSTVNLHTAFPNEGDLFPANVIMHGASIYQEATLDDSASALSAATLDLGIASGDVDFLLDGVDLFTGTGLKGIQGVGSIFSTQAAFVPAVVLATTGANGADLTVGRFGIRIYFTPHPLYA